MKLLIYMPIFARGGLERVISNLAKMFADNDYEVTFVSKCIVDNEYELHSKLKRVNMDISGNNLLVMLFELLNLRMIIKREKPDVMLAFAPGPILKITLSNLFLNFPIIISQRNDPYVQSKMPLRTTIFRYIYPLADGCVFQTVEARDYFPAKLKRKSTIITNLVDNAFFEAQQIGERKNIVAVGRLHPQKKWDIAIKAFSLIADKVQDNLIIYGEGDEHNNLESLIARLNLCGRVILAGVTTEVEKVVINAKLFVLSSDVEGIPNALIEALVMGVPCVSTRFSGGGADALIESGVNGILVPNGDYEAMAKAMMDVLSDSEYAERMRRVAKERAEEFKPERVWVQWENYILSVVKKHEEESKSR